VWRWRDDFMKVLWRLRSSLRSCCDALVLGASGSFGLLGLDRFAIGAAGHQTILELSIGVKFVRQKPSDHEQQHDDHKRDHWASAAAVVIVLLAHAAPS
jgi:hypothetical protein